MKNQSDSKTIVKNIGFLYNGEIVGQILTLILVIVISRQLGDVGLGKYSFAFSFAAIFLFLADFGLPTLITKEVAKDRRLAEDHITKTFTLKFILNVLTLFATVLAIAVSKKDSETVLLVLIAGMAMFFYNFAGIFRSIFQAYEVMKYEVIAKTAERIIAASVGIYLLLNGYGIFSLFLTLLASNFFYYAIMHYLASKKICKAKIVLDYSHWKRTVKSSFPFWMTLIFVSFYVRIDTIMLGFMKDYASTGWYNAAYRIIDVFVRILFLPIIAVFPALSKFHKTSLPKTRMLYEKSFYYMLVLSVPIVTGLVMLSQKIILAVYGSQFVNSVIALQILGFALLFTSLNYLMGYLLNSIDRQKFFAITTGSATALNIILNLVLIPLYGYIGAGIATVASEIINFGMLYYFTNKNDFTVNILKLALKPLISATVMAFAVYFLNVYLNIIFLSLIGAVIYFSAMFAIKGLGKEDVNLVKSFF